MRSFPTPPRPWYPMKQAAAACAAVALLFGCAGRAHAFLWTSVVVEPDVTYCEHFGQKLKMHISRPRAGDGPAPAVVLIHGGGWVSGTPNGLLPLSWKLAREGYVVAAVGYRLSPAAAFPAAAHDVKCAVRWLRANAARYGIDRNRVAAVGYSAGGQLACLLGMTGPEDGLEGHCGFLGMGRCPLEPSAVQCVVCCCGVTDLAHWHECAQKKSLKHLAGPLVPFSLKSYLGLPPEQADGALAKASPITYARKGAAPTLLIHGTADGLVPFEQSEKMEKKLRAAGVAARLLALDGADHDWAGAHAVRAETAILEFLNAQLKRVPPRQ